MSSSPHPTTQHPSSHYLESSGAILFHLSTQRIVLLHSPSLSQYLLPKGRRHTNESRSAATIREVTEETGYPCRLLPISIETRATTMGAGPDEGDEVRMYVGSEEPFMLTLRGVGEGRVKLIWWFVAGVEEDGEVEACEEGFERVLIGYEEAVGMLTFREDRDVVERAVGIVRAGGY